MLKFSFNVLSVGASIDSQTGNLSVFDFIDEVRTPQLPILLQSLIINVGIQKLEPNRPFAGQILIHQVAPDGTSGVLAKGDLKISEDQQKMKIVFRFNGMQINQFGNYKFVVSILDQNNNKFLESISELDCVKIYQPPTLVKSTLN